MSVMGAGGGEMAPSSSTPGSRFALNDFVIFLTESHSFPHSSVGPGESISTVLSARAPSHQIVVATPLGFPSTSDLYGSRVQNG